MKEKLSANPVSICRPGEVDGIAAVILDVDGTLYDQAVIRRKMASELISAYILKPAAGFRLFRFLRRYRQAQERLRGLDLDGKAAQAQLLWACECSHTDVEVARAYLERWFFTAPLKHVCAAIRPGAVEFLSAMKQRGVRLGAFSDYPATTKLDALGVARFFDAIVSSSDPEVQGFKPNPSGLLLCAKRLGIMPQRVLYVGDRPDVDAECARRAGASAAILQVAGQRDSTADQSWYSAASFPVLLGELLRGGLH